MGGERGTVVEIQHRPGEGREGGAFMIEARRGDVAVVVPAAIRQEVPAAVLARLAQREPKAASASGAGATPRAGANNLGQVDAVAGRVRELMRFHEDTRKRADGLAVGEGHTERNSRRERGITVRMRADSSGAGAWNEASLSGHRGGVRASREECRGGEMDGHRCRVAAMRDNGKDAVSSSRGCLDGPPNGRTASFRGGGTVEQAATGQASTPENCDAPHTEA